MTGHPKRSEDRDHTPKPGRPGGDLHEKAEVPRGVRPEDKKDEGDPALNELESGREDPGVDLNEERQR